MRDLLAELMSVVDSDRDCVYCAIVETRGSTPQKAGAVMLVYPDGSQCGTLGGGCVEAEVKHRALQVLQGRGDQSELLTFCLDDNYGWDDGLICGGRMTILAEPLHSGRLGQASAYFRRFHELIDGGTGCTEAVVLTDKHAPLPIGARFLFDRSGQLVGRTMEGRLPQSIADSLVPLSRRPVASVQHGVAYLPHLPRITLLIVGGGHVGQAVARLAADVDFEIWVVDDRQAYVSRERFPSAHRILIGDIGQVLKELARQAITPATYCIVVTRGHAHDEEALYHLAQTPAGYLGMIGSKRKIKLIYEDLLAKGVAAETLAKVHAPLGFAIGSQTVPEIAVSIVAELIAYRNLGASIRAARVQVPVG